MPVYSFIARADCFLMPSRFEGSPNVVLESLACGTPVIATAESGGIEEIAKDCPAGSVRIVRGMKEFIQEMKNIRPGEKTKPAPPQLAKTYHQDKVCGEFESILDELMHQS
jgi:glycosyltransferase involved in cell wall biosynthesis